MSDLFRRPRRLIICWALATVLFSSALAVSYQQKHQAQNPSQIKSTAKTLDTQWYNFRGPDNDFTINFPVKPQRDKDIQGPVTIVRQYSSATDTLWLGISIEDFGGAPDDPASNDWGPNFDRKFSKQWQEEGIKIVQLRRPAKNIYEMEAWSPASTPGDHQHFLSRGILRYGRYYRLGCNSLIKNHEVDKNICHRFFSSFRIIGLPQ